MTRQTKNKADAVEAADFLPLLPLYHRLYSSLLQHITDGVFPTDARLPGELELCESFGVSRATVRRALLRLEQEGLVSRQRGAGTFVRKPAENAGRPPSVAPLTQHVGAQSFDYESRLIDFSYVPTPAFLDAGPEGYGPVVLRLSRVTMIAGQPIHFHIAYVPERYGRHVDRTSIGSKPLVLVLRDQGVEVEEADLFIEAAAADAQQAEALGVPLGAPLIRGVHLSKAPGGAPLEYNTTVSRPDRFRYWFRSDERHGVITPVRGLREPIASAGR